MLLVGWWLARTFLTGGEDITITFDDVHGLKQSNSNVIYRGMNVGRVTGMELAKDGKTVEVKVNIQDSATEFLKSGTQFWLRGAEPSLSDPASLSSVLSGPTIIMEPGSGQKTTHFVGLAHKPVVADAEGPRQIYQILLNGAVGELKQGEPVKLRGFTVGEVTDIGFRYDPKSDKIMTPVTVALYPSLFHLEASGGSDAKTALAAAIERLIEEGLRGRLERNPPLVGTLAIELDMMPGTDSPTAAFVDGMPQIPAAPGGGLNS
ncbi:MAG TPA: MlaD family protein, partial [Stellaceae bacterium]|nr:MlaD family protein [Stellaceae bacterium]